MNDDQPDWCLQTRLVHAGERAPAPGSTPTATPIYTSATYLHADLSALDTALESGSGYVYTRYGNPTVAALEEAMTVVERGAGATAFASGMAALYAALLAAGTPRGATAPAPRAILAARDMYGATTLLLQEFFAARGTRIATCDMCDLNAVDAALEAYRPDVLLVEQLSNPLLRVIDIRALAQRARAAGARLAVDSTKSRGGQNETQRIEETMQCLTVGCTQLKRDKRAKQPSKHFGCQRMLRMAGKTRIVHGCNRRVGGQPGCNLSSGTTLLTHTQRQRLQAAQNLVCLEWSQRGTQQSRLAP